MVAGKSVQQEVDERASMTGTNKFELLLFRLGGGEDDERSELFGINVFKVREIVAMPKVTEIAGSLPHMLGVVNIRGQIIPVIDLPAMVGCVPKTGLNIMLVTEFARNAQAFAVEAVEDIVRLDWNQVLPAEQGVANGMVTSIARMDSDIESSRLIQVLDVESILSRVSPGGAGRVDPEAIGEPASELEPGQIVLAADDSAVARSLIEQSLETMGVPHVMTKSGKEAWEKLTQLADEATKAGEPLSKKVGMVMTDLEMPELDGFTLTKMIKQDNRMIGIPVVIHSSLTGSANEAHVRNVGADAYVAKFEAGELASTIRRALAQRDGR